MNNKIKVLVATIALFSSTVFAQSGIYFGIGAYQTTHEVTSSVTIGSATESVTESRSLEYKKTNIKALIGQRINDNFSIEGQYVNFAKDNAATTLTATVEGTVAGTTDSYDVDYARELSGSSIGLAGLYHFNAQADYSPFVKIGMHAWDVEGQYARETTTTTTNTNTGTITNNTITDSGKIDRDGTDLFYGFGVDGKINDTTKYRVEFERMEADDEYLGNFDIDNFGVSVLFSF